jgi:hypothetical protein
MSDSVVPPVNRFTVRRDVLRQCGRTSDGWSALAWMEKIMSKTNDTERTREPEAKRAELLDSELDTVTGGVSDLGKYITKAVDDAISAA